MSGALPLAALPPEVVTGDGDTLLTLRAAPATHVTVRGLTKSFSGKPAAIIGTSPGARGTALAQQHLRNVFVGLDVLALAPPEVTVQFQEGLIDEEGRIGDERTLKFLQKFVDRYSTWLIKTLA